MTGTKVNPQVKAASVVAASQRVAVLQIEPTPQSSFDLRNVPGQCRMPLSVLVRNYGRPAFGRVRDDGYARHGAPIDQGTELLTEHVDEIVGSDSLLRHLVSSSIRDGYSIGRVVARLIEVPPFVTGGAA